MKKFCANLKKASDRNKQLWKKRMLPLTKKEQKLYNKQNFCHVCHEKIDEEPNEDIKAIVKVRDHCHYTGKYWGAAYSICNVKY